MFLAKRVCVLNRDINRLGILSNCFWSSIFVRHNKNHTAGILVIGDEILKGQVRDTNSGYLAKELHRRGYQVDTITVVPDEVGIISTKVRQFSQQYNIVLTTGGIGPTHDDVTYEAIADAFGDKLEYHPKLVELCQTYYKTTDKNYPGYKLAYIPKSSILTYGVNEGKLTFWLPVVSVSNVHILPGVPHLCEKLFETCGQLFPVVGKNLVKFIYVDTVESKLTPKLNEAVDKFPSVQFGSYPIFFHSYFKVKLTMQSSLEVDVEAAAEFLRKEIPCVVQYDENYLNDSLSKLESINNPLLNSTFEALKNVVGRTDPKNIFLFFDGGKNSTLVLHLLSLLIKRLNVIYVEKDKKITPYVTNAVKSYKANLLTLDQINFERFMKSDENILIIKGTRTTDPNSQKILNYFSKFNTFNPLSNWNYNDVWLVIRSLYLPYCDLYNRGYSSLLGPINSQLIIDGPRKDIVYYKSAHLLDDEQSE